MTGYCVNTYRKMRTEGYNHSTAMFFAELNYQFLTNNQ